MCAEDIWSRVLRKIFGPEREQVTGDWRKLHSSEFQDFITSH